MKFQTKRKIVNIVSIILLVYYLLNIFFTPFPEIQRIIVLVLLIIHSVFVLIMLRCPYCNKFIRSTKYNHCPHCGKDLVDE